MGYLYETIRFITQKYGNKGIISTYNTKNKLIPLQTSYNILFINLVLYNDE
jgi:hypothetical protein